MTTNKQIRVKMAMERQALSEKLSPKERLEKLNQKFGEGLGAKKERAKLQKMMSSHGKKDETIEQVLKTTLSPEIMAQIEEMNAPSVKKSKKNK